MPTINQLDVVYLDLYFCIGHIGYRFIQHLHLRPSELQ